VTTQDIRRRANLSVTAITVGGAGELWKFVKTRRESLGTTAASDMADGGGTRCLLTGTLQDVAKFNSVLKKRNLSNGM
jgi:hypothetical protein